MTIKINSFEKAIHIAKKYEQKCRVRDNRFAVFRLISTIILLAVLVSFASGKSYLWIFFLFCGFLFYCFLTSFLHKKVQEKQKFWETLLKSYELSQARVLRNFTFIKENIAPWHEKISVLPPNHLYACDLDIHQELFFLLNTCSTEGGSRRLFNLLLSAGVTPCEKKEIDKHIQVATKLSHQKSLLRRFESMRLSEEFLKNYYKSTEVSQEGTGNMSVIFTYAFVSISAWLFLFIPQFLKFSQTKNIDLFLQPLFIYAMFILFGVYLFQPLINKSIFVARNTKYIELVREGLGLQTRRPHFRKMEEENFINQLPFAFLNLSSMKKIRWMNFFVDILSLRGNPVFWVFIHIFFPFDAVFCLLLFFVVKKTISHLPAWQNEIDEFDLLMSFARLKCENPDFCFISPVIENNKNNLHVSQMGHPLLPKHKRVCNSLTLTQNSPLVLLTGSNMSGKSTFLRTFATNILLSNMGAPLCAEQFLVPPMRILCAIRIDDSLTEGTSYFYAEVKRLAEILHQLKTSSEPCLFFIDEIFKGTNNKERYLGGLSMIKAFLQCNSFGFVSTHDLALTELAENEPRIRNMHFRESIYTLRGHRLRFSSIYDEGRELRAARGVPCTLRRRRYTNDAATKRKLCPRKVYKDKLTFDYTLKEGPCPTTNALFIMKLAGLPV